MMKKLAVILTLVGGFSTMHLKNTKNVLTKHQTSSMKLNHKKFPNTLL